MTDLNIAISSLAITGAVVSVLAQLTKRWLNGRADKMIWVIVLSAIGGTLLYSAQFIPAAWWQVALAVWVMANTVYLAIIKFLEPQN